MTVKGKRIDCTRKRETEKAVQVVLHETGEIVWIPLSQVESMHFNLQQEGYMMITDWIAEAKDL
jgi:hypothetical protein